MFDNQITWLKENWQSAIAIAGIAIAGAVVIYYAGKWLLKKASEVY